MLRKGQKYGKQRKEEHNKMGLRKLFYATKNTIDGICAVWRNEAAFRMEVFVVVFALIVLFSLEIAFMSKVILFGALMLLLIVELLNSAVESLCDLVKAEYNVFVKSAKDIASAAVGLTILLNVVLWLFLLLDLLE
jgi:diacylglycerol kinase (ATP)